MGTISVLRCGPFREKAVMGMTPIERVQAIGWDVDSATGCWEWRGERMPITLRARVYTPSGRKYVYRLTYEATFGPIAAGLVACHKCDNPGCVNPQHIVPDTQAHNMSMMAARGVARPGRDTTDEALRHRIATLYATGLITQTQISRAFELSPTTVAKYVARTIEEM